MQKQSLNQNWRFSLDEAALNPWGAQNEDGWQVVNLPHDWSIGLERAASNPSGASNGFFQMGRGIYIRTFDVPESWQGKQVMIEFEGVYMNAEVWLNDQYLGGHPYGYTSFWYDLNPYLKIGQTNRLKVVVDNSHQMNSRWYSGSGIYRPVWLYVAEPVHVAPWGVSVTTPQGSAQESTVLARTTIANQGEQAAQVALKTRVLNAAGEVVAEGQVQAQITAGAQHEFSQELTVQDAHLWSPDAPYLYTLATDVQVGGEVVDRQSTPFGIRSIAFNAQQGFLLNRQPLLLKGGCVHHDNGILGAAAFARSEERKVQVHKDSGYNAIRTAHNPPSPAFLDACDRLGMLVMDEAFDCWRQGKNPGDYHLSFDDWWQRDVSSMVLRDRNHPSIIIWSIGNEVIERDGRSGGEEIARKLADEVHRLDPTRPVTSAINGLGRDNQDWAKTDAVFAKLDVGGYNYQWRQYVPDHERMPNRVMAGTESIAMEAFENWMSVVDHPYVIGDFVWTSLDYLGESGIGRAHFDASKPFLGEYPWHQANCGDLDLTGFKRPQSYYRDMLWGVGQPVYLAVHAPVPEGKTEQITFWGWPDVRESWNWAGLEGQNMQVHVYSACEQVELFLNGKSLGVKASGNAERRMATYEVPYEPGELKVVGLNAGSAVASRALQTAGDPQGLRLSADRERLSTQEGELAFVTVDVVDAQGCRHPNASHEVFFTVQGEGILQAVGSADPVSTERYQGNQRKAYQGRCVVVVRPNGKPGIITLRAQADGLNPAEITLRVE